MPDDLAHEIETIASPRPPPQNLRENLRFRLKILRADLGNFFLYEYRSVDGFLITGKNSGTHWIKYMLSCAIAHAHNVPPPAYASGRQANSIIGHPSTKPVHSALPRIGSAHTLPSLAFRWPWLNRLVPHPPVVILVRDIQSAMLSNYIKWRETYRVSLAEYVHGDPAGKRFLADIWWYIHFFNRWGDIAQARPRDILILRYEDLQHDPHAALTAAARHWRLNLPETAMAAALPYTSRTALREKLDPNFNETVIPDPTLKETLRFSPADLNFIHKTLRQHLRHNLGYPGTFTRHTAQAVSLATRKV